MNPKNIVVTGVSGYIGGQTAITLKEAGHNVFGIDLRPLPKHLEPFVAQFYQTDVCSGRGLDIMANTGIDAVVHCAGTSLVGPSKINPQEYFHNNVGKTLAMLDSFLELEKRPRVIFSSSASVYGNPVMTPCEEIDPVAPISPYGQSKLMIEWFLESYAQAYGLDFVAFRYFNAAGADPEGRHGQEPGATHIVARALESLINSTEFTCNGNEYDTKDGTCVRDYVHVDDIASAHAVAVDIAVPPGIYNLGNSLGYSNLDVVKTVEEISGKTVNLKFGPARDGDPATLTANGVKFSDTTGWRPKYDLTNIITHAWSWHNK